MAALHSLFMCPYYLAIKYLKAELKALHLLKNSLLILVHTAVLRVEDHI